MTQTMTAARPLPEITGMTAPFWEAARRHELVIQRCTACAQYRFPPELACFSCGSREATWAPVSGRAVLYTWTLAHPPLLPYFAERAPWPIAAVQLEEGPRLVTNLRDVRPEEYVIGMPLEADFERIDESVTLVVFRRARERAAGNAPAG
jgi:uncharacterized OB-fold protein